MPKLRFENGPRRGTEFSFDKLVLVGRGGSADLSIDDPTISRRHAVLRWTNNECVVLDLGSGNGTQVNGRLLSRPARLRNGDVVTIGGVSATYTDTVDRPDATNPLRDITVVHDAPDVLLRIPATQEADAARLGQLRPGETIEALSRRLGFLNELGKIASLIFDEPALLSFVLEQLFGLLPQTERGFVMLWDATAASLLPKASRTRDGESPFVVSQTMIGDVLRRHEAVLVTDARADPRYSQAESVMALGIRSAMAVPILFHDEFLGIVQIDSAAGVRFGKTDLVLLVGIAAQVGMALAYARLHARLVQQHLLEQDMELARRIQERFLPESTPVDQGYSFAALCNPALDVGGDFYDFLDLGDGLIGVVIGDVSGKGVSAALYGAKLTSELRHYAVDQRDPRAILTRLNRVLTRRDTEGMFATVIVIVLDRRTGRISIANAGHPLPYLRTSDGTTSAFGQLGGIPVGMFEDCKYALVDHALEHGDHLVLYSDGVTEALNERGELFGDERLVATVRRSKSGATALMQAIATDVRSFAGSRAQSDDVTIVCFGRDAKTTSTGPR